MSTFLCAILTSFCLQIAFGIQKYRPPTRTIDRKWTAKQSPPGLQYISRGYNILFGNPHTTGNVDEGISGAIFNLINCSNGQTYRNYTVPNGVSILPSPTCTQEFTYNAVTGVKSYSSSLTQDTSFDVKGWGAAFSASVDYQSIYKKTTTTKTTYTSTYTQCACYAATLNQPYDLPAFTENFKETIANMPDFYDINNQTNNQFFYDFFTHYFGTHYITGVTMGGIFGTLSSMNSFSYSQFSSSNLDISVSASYSCLGESAAASSMTDKQKNESADFNSITTSTKIFNIGGNLPSNNNPATWQQDLAANPLPIYYKFDVIPNLLTETYFPNMNDINKKQSALQSALNVYCKILSENDTFGIIDCNGYPADPSMPGKSIIQGFYADNIDSEPVNPYTKTYSCNNGYDAIPYYSYWDSITSEHYTGYYCLNSTMNKHDALYYFGGFYENCVDQNNQNGQCNQVNHFTNGCTCPTGYDSWAVSEGLTNHYKSNCWSDNGWAILETFICYNKSVPLTESIVAGMYSVNPSNGDCGTGGMPNQYTKTTSCHTGFSPYITGHQCCYSTDGNCHAVAETYMCLNNIYPV
eukprot:446640_1